MTALIIIYPKKSPNKIMSNIVSSKFTIYVAILVSYCRQKALNYIGQLNIEALTVSSFEILLLVSSFLTQMICIKFGKLALKLIATDLSNKWIIKHKFPASNCTFSLIIYRNTTQKQNWVDMGFIEIDKTLRW